MKNSKNLKVKALVDSRCTHTGIDEQLVKDKRIQTKSIDFSFEVFNADGTKNGEVTKVVPLEIEINRHKETVMIDALRIPQGYCMDKGQGYDDNDRLRRSNLSQCLM